MLFFAAGAYSVEYNTDMLQKNLNADMTNPNVYHSIDENFEDHVYDEIKQKDGYNPGECIEWISNISIGNNVFIFLSLSLFLSESPSDEYDHLDYSSRPGSSFKPHYHRMNDVLNITKDEKEVKESNIESSNNLDAPGKSLMDYSKASYSSGDSNS